MLAINPANGFMYYNKDGEPTGWEQFGTSDPTPGGEANTGANVGNAGGNPFRDKTGVVLNFRRSQGIAPITAADNGDLIDFDFNIEPLTLVASAVDADHVLMRQASSGNNVRIAVSDFLGVVGEENTGINLGDGVQVFASKSGVTLQFRSIDEIATDPITWVQNALDVTATLDFSKPPATASVDPADLILIAKDGTLAVERATAADFDVTTGSNLGPGRQVFEAKVGSDLRFRTLIQTTNDPIVLVQDGDSIDFTLDIEQAATIATPIQETDVVLIQRPLAGVTSTAISTLLAATSVGTGVDVFKGRVSGVAEFRSLTTVVGNPMLVVERTDDAEIVFRMDDLTPITSLNSDDAFVVFRNDSSYARIDWSNFQTGGANLGTGANVFSALVGQDLEFRSLTTVAANPMSITEQTTEIDIEFDILKVALNPFVAQDDQVLVKRVDDTYARVLWSTLQPIGAVSGVNLGTGAAIVGTYGVRADIPPLSAQATKHLPQPEKRTRFRFYFDINSLTIPEGTEFRIAQLDEEGLLFATAAIELGWTAATGYRVRASGWDDTLGTQFGAWVNVTDAVHWFEIDHFADDDFQEEGFVTFWVDDVEQYTLSGLDNWEFPSFSLTIGAVPTIPGGTEGAIYFDQLEIRRETFIGEFGTTLPAPVTDFIFDDGFEDGTFDAWDSVSGSVTIEQTEGAAVFSGNSGNVLVFRRLFQIPGTPLVLTETTNTVDFDFDPSVLPSVVSSTLAETDELILERADASSAISTIPSIRKYLITGVAEQGSPVAADLLMMLSSVDDNMYGVLMGDVANTATSFVQKSGDTMSGNLTLDQSFLETDPTLFIQTIGAAGHLAARIQLTPDNTGTLGTIEQWGYTASLDGAMRLKTTGRLVLDVAGGGIDANANLIIDRSFLGANPLIHVINSGSTAASLLHLSPGSQIGKVEQYAQNHGSHPSKMRLATSGNMELSATDGIALVSIVKDTEPNGVEVYRGVSLTMSTGSVIPIDFLETNRISDSGYWSAGAPTNVVVQDNGPHDVHLEAAFQSGTFLIELLMFINGSASDSIKMPGDSNTTRYRFSSRRILSAGDIVTMRIRHNTGAARNLTEAVMTVDKTV
jgi:hypothetical protein